MNSSSLSPWGSLFRLRVGAVECDEEGPRVAGVRLLDKAQDARRGERWRVPALPEIETRLRRAYDRRIGAGDKLGALHAVARALDDGELARAQIATLLLRLPNPPEAGAESSDGHILDKALNDNGWLVKEWESDDHPRAGVAPNPGWFAPKDKDEPSSKPQTDHQVAQAEGGVVLPPDASAEDPATVRRKIADIARSWVGSTKWADDISYSIVFGRKTNKCFLFVRDVLAQAGVDPGAPNELHGFSRPPFAGQWGDSSYEIPGWVVLKDGEIPAPGDVVAQQLGYGDASGHVMIVGGGGAFIGTGDAPGAAPGSIELIQTRDFLGPPERRYDPRFRRGPLVYRRWVGQ